MPTCLWCEADLRPTAAYCAHCGQSLTPGTAPPLAPGTRLQGGRYRLQQRLGGGGTGDVYLAQDTRLFNQAVVVKRLLVRTSQPAARAAAEQSFRQEAYALAGLHHSQIPRILDFFSDPPALYLVMEYMPGPTLAQCLDQQGGQLAAATVAAIGGQVATLLAYLHSQQPPIIHQDIKPANLILGPAGTVTLVDFGIARARPVHTPPSRSGVHTAWGTIGYAPPEQLAGQAGPPADVYALGATLRELLTGAGPTVPIRGFALPPPAPTAALVDQMIPLITAMMDPDPRARPPAPTLVRQWAALAAAFPIPRDETPPPGPDVGPAPPAPRARRGPAAVRVRRWPPLLLGGLAGLAAVLVLLPGGALFVCQLSTLLIVFLTRAAWPLALMGAGLAIVLWRHRGGPLPRLPRVLTLALGLELGLGLPILVRVLLQTLGGLGSCP